MRVEQTALAVERSDRTGEVTETTKQRGKYDFARERPIQHLWRGQPIERHPEDAGEARERSRNQEGDPAEPANAQTEEGGTDFVVANGLQRFAEWGVDESSDSHDKTFRSFETDDSKTNAQAFSENQFSLVLPYKNPGGFFMLFQPRYIIFMVYFP